MISYSRDDALDTLIVDLLDRVLDGVLDDTNEDSLDGMLHGVIDGQVYILLNDSPIDQCDANKAIWPLDRRDTDNMCDNLSVMLKMSPRRLSSYVYALFMHRNFALQCTNTPF